IFICTYPKSGTTWIQYIVHQLLGETQFHTPSYTVLNRVESLNGKLTNRYSAMLFISPTIELMGAVYSDTIQTPRVLKSHFTFRDIPKGGGAKYTYACRNPKDVLTSYYHHHRNFKRFEFEHGDFNVFFDLFMDVNVMFGDYFEHLTSWLEGIETSQEQILFLKYEDMIAVLKSSVVKIANFIGGNVAELIRNEKQLSRIVNSSTVESMMKNQQRWFPKNTLARRPFIRKGGSRDWKTHFSNEQSEQMD
ncbi:hypothetical protein PENTCL1PPCAC_16196, partial [Pristionchus entomophagus]